MDKDIREYSSMVRMAYNRIKEGWPDNQTWHHLKKIFGVNCWLASSAAREARGIFNLNKNKPIIFGGKSNLIRYLKGAISKNTFKEKRLFPLCSIGEKRYGNRLFNLDFLNNKIIFKPKKNIKKEIQFLPQKKKRVNELMALQEGVRYKKIPVTIKCTSKYVYLMFDESLIRNAPYKNLKANRILGIDMNPNYIGMSVIEFDTRDEFKVLHTEVFDLTTLTKTSGKECADKKSKYLTHKLKHETIAIAHKINKAVDYWKCATLAIEDISLAPKDHKKGKDLNRICNNKWERLLFINKLKMLAGIHRYELSEVNPAYSSIVGNFMYGGPNTPDMVAASIEIARRAYKRFEKGWFYPKFNVERLDERWKQTLAGVKTWKELAQKVKESGLKYRFLLADCIRNAVFRTSHKKGRWKILYFS